MADASRPMAEWNLQQVVERFHEAAVTAHRLPAVRVQGYASSWPDVARQAWEGYADERRVLRLPATPAAIDRFIGTSRWLGWLSVEQRHLVWLRARYVPWRAIGAQIGCDARTARRRWHHAMAILVTQLNGVLPRISPSESS